MAKNKLSHEFSCRSQFLKYIVLFKIGFMICITHLMPQNRAAIQTTPEKSKVLDRLEYDWTTDCKQFQLKA